MIREHLFSKRAPADPDFRWRGGDVSRIEGISDGVFSITLTLLIVSTVAPSNFYDLWILVRDLPAFIFSYALIMLAWYSHYLFFRRYGLEDFPTSIINAAFLFVIMFFAYPLKFLCVFLWYLIIGVDIGPLFSVPDGFSFSQVVFGVSDNYFQRTGMMYFYGVGLIGVFGLLAALHFRALILKTELELDKLEREITINSMIHHLITVFVGIFSLVLLYITGNAGASGIVYFSLPIFHTGMGFIGGNRIKQIKKELG